MLVNLCHSSLKPAIVCNKPTYDGYEINNLIQQTSYRNQGFMVERFIKPPVTVTLKFPCNVEIFKICINPFVGQQKSLGFEVHTKSEAVKDSWLMNSSLTPSVNTDGIFVPVGRALLKEAKIFCFRNYSFKGQQEIPSTMRCQLELPLKHHQQKSLTFVSHVSLRITQTEGSSVPCIGKLEIWAKPMSNGVANLVPKVYSCFKEHPLNDQVHEEDSVDKDNFINQNATSLPTNNNSFNLNGVDVPEDFLDPITCEIMSMPMLLPSGQSVDQSTLVNYNNAESKWGRTPNNLFTSIKFTSTYKPVPNTSLKVRIDKFLLDNSQQLSNVPRTIGRASDIQNQGLSIENKDWVQPARSRVDSQKTCSQTFLQHGNSSTKLKESCPSLDKHPNVAASSLNGHNIKSHSKHENISNSFTQSRTTDGKSFQMPIPRLKRKTLSSSKADDDVGNTVKRQQTSERAQVIRDSHENDLNQSLEAALSQTLGTLPSFRTPVMNSKEVTVRKCASCQIRDEVHLYVLPCTHILCRKCLNSNYRNENGTMKYFCLQCEDSYNSKEIQRLYD